MTTNPKPATEALPERTTCTLCKCGAMRVGQNNCPYCGRDWSEGISAEYQRTPPPTEPTARIAKVLDDQFNGWS